MSDSYGYGGGVNDATRNSLAATIMNIRRPPPVSPAQQLVQQPPGVMPQSQPAAQGPPGPPTGPMGTGVPGPYGPGLNLPGVMPPGQLPQGMNPQAVMGGQPSAPTAMPPPGGLRQSY